MHVVLWDTRSRPVAKDGLGGWESWPAAPAWQRLFADRRPVPLRWAYLAAILRRLGHSVEYAVDYVPATGKLFIFQPALGSLEVERRAIEQVARLAPKAQMLLAGPVAAAWPGAFAGLPVKILRGEPEQLLWKLDDVLACGSSLINLGQVDDLDTLPWPDWAPFQYEDFRLPFELGARRAGSIHLSRGDATSLADGALRHRSPERVVSELRHQVLSCGCEAFRFCDPCFAARPERAFRLAELLAQLPSRIPFAVESRAEWLPHDLLRVLRSVGLVCVTLAVAREELFEVSNRAKLRDVVALCNRLAIRTVVRLRLNPAVDDGNAELRAALAEVNATRVEVDIAPEFLGNLVAELRAGSALPANTTGTSAAELATRLKAEQRRLRNLARDVLAGYYGRLRYWREQASVRWPAWKRLAIWRHADKPETDLAHRETPKPLGGLDRRTTGSSLRKDSPHKRAAVRHNPDRPS